MPTSAGGSITWTSGFDPTSTSRPPGTIATSSATPTPVPQASGSGLSTGAKAGIGVGAAAAALLIIGALFWCVRRHRRARDNREKQQPQQAQEYGHPQGPWSPATTYLHPGSVSTAHSPATVTTTIVGGGDPHPWASSPSPKPYWMLGNDAFTGYKNELPADEIQPVAQPSSPHKGMGAPSSPDDRIGRADSTASGVMLDAPAQDSMGRFYVSPQSTGQSGPHSGHVGAGASRGNYASEMQG